MARSVIFASNVPKYASGKVVLGAEFVVRLKADGAAVPARGWTVPGKDGTAKDGSIWEFCPSSETMDTKVNGSIGSGVSEKQIN